MNAAHKIVELEAEVTRLRAEIDRLGNELKAQTETVQHLIGERTADRNHWGAIEDNLNRAERILAALREPSEALVEAVAKAQEPRWWPMLPASVRALRRQSANRILRAAVTAAAEQEVGRE